LIELKAPLWKLLTQGVTMYVLAVFMMRGQLLKRRLRQTLMPSRHLRGRNVAQHA
jgi:hypothetical protein